MTRLFKNRFLWRFTGGFVLGTFGMLAMQGGAPMPDAPQPVPPAAATR